MAYLSPHFEQDVFVSYSHGDPRAGTLKEWTLELVRKLERDMWDSGPEFTGFYIWRDEDLDPTSANRGNKGKRQIFGNSVHRHVAALS